MAFSASPQHSSSKLGFAFGLRLNSNLLDCLSHAKLLIKYRKAQECLLQRFGQNVNISRIIHLFTIFFVTLATPKLLALGIKKNKFFCSALVFFVTLLQLFTLIRY